MSALRSLERGGSGFDAFESLLAEAGLPTDDLDGAARLFAMDANRAIVGYGGLEGNGPDLMVRSVVVPASQRGRGHGGMIAEALAGQARADGAERLWLLTTSADGFFADRVWTVMDRASAPDAVRSSRQYSGLCPASAVLMCRRLA